MKLIACKKYPVIVILSEAFCFKIHFTLFTTHFQIVIFLVILFLDKNVFWPLSTKMLELNPIWTGLFANLKRLGGGAFCSPPLNFAISSQKMMKLGKSILWVEVFTN